ncbi:type VII secretion integral membrane protein EccD [Streptomyces triticagri]|uniref:Type VII secretion integral membrane protein EccD n=1 Tax=Streptomyces triticagri TaxID=2293568 RepID=A0A372LXQ6_9ACTN|nr:type VII secretion integral membrane protein EccD [Streptomyces triticagri]
MRATSPRPADPARPAAHAGPHPGFCRVTVITPDRRVDLALPDDLPLADLRPDILRLTGPHTAEEALAGHHFVLRDGTVLDTAESLAAQRVPDGGMLLLRPFADSLPPPVHDDVSEAVAAAVSRDHTRWSGAHTRIAGLTGSAVVLALLAFALWQTPPGHVTHGLPAVLAAAVCALLAALSGTCARVYGDHGAAAVFGTAALAHAAVAGSGALPPAAGHGAGKLQFLTACVGVLLVALILVVVTPRGDSVFVALLGAAVVGVAVTLPVILHGARSLDAAALCVPTAIGLLAFLPGLSARWARLPSPFEPPRPAPGPYEPDDTPPPPEPVDLARVETRSRRGHELLVGLVASCGIAVTAAAAVLVCSGDLWARLLTLAAGLALLTRARLFHYTAQVAVCLVAGLATLTVLIAGMALTPPADGLHARVIWLTVALAAGAALCATAGLAVAHRGMTPFWGRLLEIVEGFVLLTLLPLCLAVLGVYHAVRAMTS